MEKNNSQYLSCSKKLKVASCFSASGIIYIDILNQERCGDIVVEVHSVLRNTLNLCKKGKMAAHGGFFAQLTFDFFVYPTEVIAHVND